MAELWILNQAINVIKNVCTNHKECDGCLFLGEKKGNCTLASSPCSWEFLEEK